MVVNLDGLGEKGTPKTHVPNVGHPGTAGRQYAKYSQTACRFPSTLFDRTDFPADVQKKMMEFEQ
jgi:hypothetical protein